MTIKSLLRPTLAATVIGVLAATAALGGAVAQADPPAPGGPGGPGPKGANPIQHVVVIFQENVSFDHYFATYPMAQNNPGEPQFQADPNTPTVNGLSGTLLTQNPNSAQPQRLGPSQALTCDQNHNYGAEQKAMDNGLMDKFVQNTGAEYKNNGVPCDPNQVMDYYDGNTVTALWNYAQNFAMSDNSFDTTFGPSTPGAVNLVSGQTHGAIVDTMAADGTISTASSQVISGKVAQGTDYSDVDPAYDDCTLTLDNNANKPVLAMTGQNVGDLLNARGVTWGWFEGGFRPTAMNGGTNANLAVCGASSKNVGGATVSDYIPHHEPFQYYASTANPHHLPPSSVAKIGQTDQANHQYDMTDFWAAVDAGNMPAVSFLKAPAYQDGHAGYSDPLDEQTFLVDTINRLEQSPDWKSTAVIINYDDSDGWYDHVMPPIVNSSNDSTDANGDALNGGACGNGTPAGGAVLRCGYGQRLPLLVISPYARTNFVDNTITDQASILTFIEDNFDLGRIGGGSYDAMSNSLTQMFNFQHPTAQPLFLDPKTGEQTGPGHDAGH